MAATQKQEWVAVLLKKRNHVTWFLQQPANFATSTLVRFHGAGLRAAEPQNLEAENKAAVTSSKAVASPQKVYVYFVASTCELSMTWTDNPRNEIWPYPPWL